jgi:hypothetical protein
VQRFVISMGDVIDLNKHPGYSWVWWFGPFGDEIVDVGLPRSASAMRARILGLFSSKGPDSTWLNIY